MKMILAILITFAYLPSHAANDENGLRGYERLNEVFFQRVFYADDGFSEIGSVIGQSLNAGFFGEPQGLITLLGYFPGGLNNGEMLNGQANSVSMLLYYILMDKIAGNLAFHCRLLDDPVIDLNYQENFYYMWSSLCRMPVDQQLDESFLQSIWTQVMGYDAPEEEFIAWSDFLKQQTFSSPEDRVYRAFLSIFLNPYMLIHQ